MNDFDLARRAHVYNSLDAQLASIGPDFLAGATAIELAHDLADADATLTAEEIVADVRAWLERHYSRAHPDQRVLELWEDLCLATEDA